MRIVVEKFCVQLPRMNDFVTTKFCKNYKIVHVFANYQTTENVILPTRQTFEEIKVVLQTFLYISKCGRKELKCSQNSQQ